MKTMGGVLCLAVALASASWSREARACSCGNDTLVFPNEASKAVGTDARVFIQNAELVHFWLSEDWGRSCESEGPELRAGDGTPFEIEVSALADVLVLTPLEPLPLGETVDVRGCGDLIAAHPLDLGRFEVRVQNDVIPPAVPGFSVGQQVDHQADDAACGDSAYRVLEFEPRDEDSFLVLDVDGRAQLDENLEGSGLSVFVGDNIAVGWTTCSVRNWEMAIDHRRVEVRAGAIDAAGNFSGWSEPVTVQFPDSSGCSVAPGSPGALWFCFVVLLARRRPAHCV